MTFERRFGRVVAVLGLLVILALTLVSIPGGAEAAASTWFWCLVCGSHGGVDVTLNLLLFVPFALGLRMAGVPFRWVVALSAAVTMFVELMQGTVLVGRDPSLSDLLTNTAGGAIGAAIGTRVRSAVLPSGRNALRLTAAGAAAWLAVLLGTAWLLQPRAPGGPLRAAWGERLPGYDTFSGTVLRARAGPHPLRPGFVADSSGLREQLAIGRVTLSYEAVLGRPRADWAPALTLLGSTGALGGLFERRDDLILELPTNADHLRLRNAALLLSGGRPKGTGGIVRVSGGARGRTYWIAAAHMEGHTYRELRLSPSFGWSLLLPFEYAFGSEVRVLTALWLAGLAFPLGYWARHAASGPARRPVVAGVFLVVTTGLIVTTGLALVPWLMGYPPMHRSEWAAALVGIGIGWAVASRVTYLAGRCASPSASESC